MNLRFTTVAGFLAAASLLSGSAFAFAPEFDGDLPTVIITDRLPAPNDSQYDLGSVSGPGVFRFTGAFDLYGYIIGGGSLTLTEKNSFRWLFTESQSPGVPESAAEGTLIINGQNSVGTIPTLVDLGTAPVLGTASTLNFWNKDFSGTNTGVTALPAAPANDYLSDITTPVHDLAASGPQERIVTIYVKGDAASMDMASFTVITKIGEGDSISGGASSVPSTPVDQFTDIVVPSGNDFSGWSNFSLNQFTVFNVSGSKNWTSYTNTAEVDQGNGLSTGGTQTILGNELVTAGMTYAPAVSPSIAGTTSLSASVSGSFTGGSTAGTANNAGSIKKIGLAIWFKNYTVAVDANTLYQVRVKAALGSATFNEVARIRVGSATSVGTSETTFLTTKNASVAVKPTLVQLATTAQDVYSTVLAKGSASVLNLALDSYSTGGAASAGGGIVISEIEIRKKARTALQDGVVLINRGEATIPALAAGEAALAPGAPTAGFVNGTLPSGTLNFGATTGQARAFSVNVTGGVELALSAQTAPGTVSQGPTAPSVTQNGWMWLSIADFAPAGGLFPADATESKFYIADVYMSSAQATGNTRFPVLRLRLQNPSNSFGDYSVFNLGANAQPVSLATAPKVYSVVANPNNYAGTAPVGAFNFFVDFWGDDTASTAGITSARTIRLHRLVITEFPKTVAP